MTNINMISLCKLLSSGADNDDAATARFRRAVREKPGSVVTEAGETPWPVSRSTSLLTAWMVVGASVAGLRTEAAPPPTDCVRTTIGPVTVDVPSVRIRPTLSPRRQALPRRPGRLGRDHALGERPEPALRRAPAFARPDAPASEIGARGAGRLRRLLLVAERQPDPEEPSDARPGARVAPAGRRARCGRQDGADRRLQTPQWRAIRRRRQHRQAQPAAYGWARRWCRSAASYPRLSSSA